MFLCNTATYLKAARFHIPEQSPCRLAAVTTSTLKTGLNDDRCNAVAPLLRLRHTS